jgi:hypothetical protein
MDVHFGIRAYQSAHQSARSIPGWRGTPQADAECRRLTRNLLSWRELARSVSGWREASRAPEAQEAQEA